MVFIILFYLGINFHHQPNLFFERQLREIKILKFKQNKKEGLKHEQNKIIKHKKVKCLKLRIKRKYSKEKLYLNLKILLYSTWRPSYS